MADRQVDTDRPDRQTNRHRQIRQTDRPDRQTNRHRQTRHTDPTHRQTETDTDRQTDPTDRPSPAQTDPNVRHRQTYIGCLTDMYGWYINEIPG